MDDGRREEILAVLIKYGIEDVVDLISKEPGIRATGIVRKSGEPEEMVKAALRTLRRDGIIVAEGSPRDFRYKTKNQEQSQT